MIEAQLTHRDEGQQEAARRHECDRRGCRVMSPGPVMFDVARDNTASQTVSKHEAVAGYHEPLKPSG